MGKPGSTSFRRMLLSRILLLSFPVLLAGQYMVYRKARSAVLTNARQTLTESASRQAEDIQAMTTLLRSQVSLTSQLFTAKTIAPTAIPAFVQQVQTQAPLQVQCVQVIQASTQQVVGSTCGMQSLAPSGAVPWAGDRLGVPPNPDQVWVTPRPTPLPEHPSQTKNQLRLVFSTPLYNVTGTITHVLHVEASLRQQVFQGASLQGYTMVVDQSGKILAHPITARLGQSITQPPTPPVLKSVLRSAIAGEQNSLHLFEENRAEWLAGYTAVRIPVWANQEETWAVLALAPIGNALAEIRDTQQTLLWLTLSLLGASAIATWLVSRDLAKPLEKLSAYARQIRDRGSLTRPPKGFKMRELNQLAEALDTMVQTLDERAVELETAWQEAQAANQLKSEFLATTSHELRTPLNAIIGSVRLIMDGCCDGPEEVDEFLKQADNAAIHLLKIINDLLDISKIEVGQIELNLQPVEMQMLCHQCLQMVTPSAERKQLELSLWVDPTLPRIPVDERRVRQMVINLLSNAVKFTPAAGTVKLSAQRRPGADLELENRVDRSPIQPDALYLCLEVTDSGIGIAPERWHLLFRPFQQIDASSTRNYEGTGLGLALTKRLVELHGGTLSFDSAVDQGSTFKIWLPIPS